MQILINSQGLNMNPLQSLYYVSPACLLGLAVPFRASSVSSAGQRFCDTLHPFSGATELWERCLRTQRPSMVVVGSG